ncbi:MAG TPA: rhodanese-like domain-containing protein [Pirellulales bacterium]|nr:rhodanese-like domain-containing protein [Pirellulales bacterium]
MRLPRSDAERLRRIDKMYAICRRMLPAAPEISPAELVERRRREKIVVVDVRSPQERAVSMIPGAISREEFEAHQQDYREAPIVAYCTLGFRSGRYVAELRRKQFDASNLAGAILAWTHTGEPLVDAQGETRRVHVYGRRWNLVASGYKGVWGAQAAAHNE